MPELPEVETVRRGLEPVLAGHVILHADVRRPDLRWPFPPGLAPRLTGARVESLGRRSKYLLAGLDRGETLIVHLGMSGRILVSGARVGAFHHPHPAPEKHDHLVLDLDGGARITLNDARRFGAVDLWPSDAIGGHRLLAGLGPEPLGNGFDAPYLAGRMAGRLAPVKAVLLDQRIVAGLGNIYVCEALWRARVSPLRLARDVGPGEAEAIVAAVRGVLIDAIDAGGSSLRDYRRADGELGYFQHAFAVYGREGRACPRCGTAIARSLQSGRSSFHCPGCQS
ncbi:MAG TPA: bifunctional DNA-formamidopyrimidine glycosylase/DNA-(apurinic or apyrimidinic site) lyase [Amaricoccus sp.]|nr:bifunctional DNA-formamidopyrimidine glycosylase/DNA-(apurinic or apyrimidinic site) lyase [Amaricoccus sp.]